MKKLHLLLLRSFMPPFAASFCIVLFILTLQFISTYQNDIFGKGFSSWVIAQLFFYAMANLVKIALPIGLLVAGLMTLGKLGEQYELAAIKSAGISLFRVMYPLLMFGVLITAMSFYLSWYIIPANNLKLYSLLYDLKEAKPEFALKPGVINSEVKDYRIWFARRGEGGKMYDFHLWDHTDHASANTRHLVADSAVVRMDHELMYLRLRLFHGARYEEVMGRQMQNGVHSAPFSRIYFDSLQYNMDMSGVGLKRHDEAQFSRHQYTQNIVDIRASIDSLKQVPVNTILLLRRTLNQNLMLDTLLKQLPTTAPRPYKRTILEQVPLPLRQQALLQAEHSARVLKQWTTDQARLYEEQVKMLRKYEVEYGMMITVPLACLIMLFIGAPLGAIIRKGGLGLPSLISILFFIVYYVLLTQGKKLATEGAVPVTLGVWLPIMVIFPIALYVTYQSSTDSRLFDMAAWKQLLGRLRRRQ